MSLKNLKKRCPYCKRVFISNSARQKFCNPVHRINYHNADGKKGANK
jgi:hypothetical protein